jgi:hypothetical protein
MAASSPVRWRLLRRCDGGFFVIDGGFFAGELARALFYVPDKNAAAASAWDENPIAMKLWRRHNQTVAEFVHQARPRIGHAPAHLAMSAAAVRAAPV